MYFVSQVLTLGHKILLTYSEYIPSTRGVVQTSHVGAPAPSLPLPFSPPLSSLPPPFPLSSPPLSSLLLPSLAPLSSLPLPYTLRSRPPYCG